MQLFFSGGHEARVRLTVQTRLFQLTQIITFSTVVTVRNLLKKKNNQSDIIYHFMLTLVYTLTYITYEEQEEEREE